MAAGRAAGRRAGPGPDGREPGGRRRAGRRPGWPRWTIGRELALLVLAGLLPFALLGLVWTNEDYRTDLARSQGHALRLARQVRDSLDGLLDDTAALTEALARVPSVARGEQPQAGRLLQELAARQPYYESLFVAGADGAILAAGGDEVRREHRLTYVQETLRAGSTVVREASAPGRGSRRVLVVATPLWDEGGRPVGAVAAAVNLLRLQEGLRQADLPANSTLLVVDRQGHIVTRRTDAESWEGRSALDSSAVRDALRQGEGVSEGDFVDGVHRLSGFASAARVPWVVVVGVPADEAYGSLRRDLWRSVARLAVAAGLAVGVAWLLSRRLTRPIGRLTAAARAYTAGDLTHRAVVARPAELAALGVTMNRMAATLQRQLAELEAARRRERAAGERAVADLTRLHSEFVAVAAHELRTPVAAAKSYAELLLRDDRPLTPAVHRQALVRLDAVCERLARLVRSLLGAARIQAGRLELECEPVDLGALARRALGDVAASAPEHELRLTVAPDRPALALADPERAEDVLVNLLANAAKYAPPGTVVQVQVAVAPAGDEVEVCVADQGPGIPPEEQDAVFERFRRGRGVAAGGVGLGLYIARAYVEAMGGRIGVRSAPGRGATFWFRLPAATAADGAGPPGATAPVAGADQAALDDSGEGPGAAPPAGRAARAPLPAGRAPQGAGPPGQPRHG